MYDMCGWSNKSKRRWKESSDEQHKRCGKRNYINKNSAKKRAAALWRRAKKIRWNEKCVANFSQPAHTYEKRVGGTLERYSSNQKLQKYARASSRFGVSTWDCSFGSAEITMQWKFFHLHFSTSPALRCCMLFVELSMLQFRIADQSKKLMLRRFVVRWVEIANNNFSFFSLSELGIFSFALMLLAVCSVLRGSDISGLEKNVVNRFSC